MEHKVKSRKNSVKYFTLVLSFLSALALLGILLIQFFFSFDQAESNAIRFNNPFFVALSFLAFLLLQYGLHRWIEKLNLSTRTLQKILTIYASIFGIVIIFLFFSPPFSDVWSVINGFLVDSWLTIPYAEYYPNNLGLVMVYQVIFKVFGRGAWPIMYVVNVLSVVGICTFIPKITGLLYNSSSERIAIQLMFFALPYFWVISYLYNDLISLALVLFSLLSLLRFIKEAPKVFTLVLSGLSLGLAYILRTNVLIFIIGIGAYLLLRAVSDRKFDVHARLSFLPVLIALSLNASFHFAAPKMISNYRTDYAQPSISWGAMALADAKTLEGYRYKQPGMFNDFESWAFEQYKKKHGQVSRQDFLRDRSAREKIYREFISKRLSQMVQNPHQALEFFGKKAIVLWGDPSLSGNYLMRQSYEHQQEMYEKLPVESLALIQGIPSGALTDFEKNRGLFRSPVAAFLVKTKSLTNFIERPFLILIVLGTGFFLLRKRFRPNLEVCLLLLIFFGGTVFHQFLWETQPRYFLPYLAVLLPIASFEFSYRISNKRK